MLRCGIDDDFVGVSYCKVLGFCLFLETDKNKVFEEPKSSFC